MKTLLLGTCALVLATACGRSEPTGERKLSKSSLIEIDLAEPPDEQPRPLISETPHNHFETLTRVRKLAEEPLAKGLFVRLGSFGGRFGDVDDWAEVFDTYRQSKKPVHCQFDEIDNGGYALAAHCDRLSMTPAGLLNLVGLAAQVVHGRSLLEQLGVKAEMLQVGKYKGAAEPFTRDALSPEQRESLENLLADLDQNFRAHLARRLKGGPEALGKLIDGGPYTSELARSAGLVDALAYDDEARAHAKRAAQAEELYRPFEASGKHGLSLPDLVRALTGGSGPERDTRPKLGVAFLSGQISDGEGRGLDGAASDPFVQALRKFRNDPAIRGVLLRIESPGGSALASDRMWHAVRSLAKQKPVVVSLGDMAASGGYYVASAGTTIVAAPGSIVGSIGVVGGKMVVSGLTDRIGVHVTTLSRAERASWLSPFQPFSPGERVAFESMLQNTYGRFLERVSQGRKRSVAELSKAAEGRVMGGARARELGLVDEVGGLARALTLARERAKLPEDAPIESWPGMSSTLSALSSILGAEASRPSLASELEAELPIELRSAGGLLRALSHSGERVLTVLPFALHVQ